MSLKTVFMVYSGISAVSLLLIVIIVNLTSYHRHYVERLDDYEKAEYFLQQDVCKNDHVRARLGDAAGCRAKEHIVKQSVRWLAITDTAMDAASWLGFSGERFSDTYMFRLYLIGGFVVLLGFWLGIFRMNANREITLTMAPILPTTAATYGNGKKKMA